MKLDYKRTLSVGFAFFLITMFWQAYDTLVPKILCDKFGLSQAASGTVMALDNVFALFLLPIFGALSDKTRSRFGRRTPYIVVGTLLSALAFIALAFVDAMQTARIAHIAPDDASLAEKAAATVAENPALLIWFIALLFVLLLSMALFRSPAVALMPDVTPKPLRSRGNAVINLMGAVGGITVLVLGILFGTGKDENRLMSFRGMILVVSVLMLLSLLVFLLTVKEPILVRKMEEESRALGIDETPSEASDASPKRRLSRGERMSLVCILAAVALWYMGYNAVTTKYSLYAGDVLHQDYNSTLIVAQAVAIVSYLPIGALSARLGRKNTILVGVGCLFTSFLFASFLRAGTPIFVMYLFFALAGFGWAAISVNSFPMVVELSRGGDVGKYTGYYYTASMAAQVLTPIVSGAFMDLSDSMTVLFPYATVFVALSFLSMLFVRHGDAHPTAGEATLKALSEEN